MRGGKMYGGRRGIVRVSLSVDKELWDCCDVRRDCL